VITLDEKNETGKPEEVVHMCHGIETGVDMERLLKVESYTQAPT